MSRGTILAKKQWFFAKNADISKIKEVLVLKGIFSKTTYMCVVMQPIDSIETYAYGTSKDLASKKEEIKCNNIIKQYEND